MREKLRLRLTKRKEEQPKKADQLSERESVVDHRRVEDLLQFINSSETKPVSSTRVKCFEQWLAYNKPYMIVDYCY